MFYKDLETKALFRLNGIVVDVNEVHSFKWDGTVIRVFLRHGNGVYEQAVSSRGMKEDELVETYLQALEAKSELQEIEHARWNRPSITDHFPEE